MNDRSLEVDDPYFDADDKSKRHSLDDGVLREPISTLEPRAPVCVGRQDSIRQAIHLMQEHRIGCVLVTEAGRLVGIFTERDVLRQVVGSDIADTAPVSDLMTPGPETLTPDTAIAFALNKMSLGGFRHVPIVDDRNTPVGIVSVKDIVEYVASFFPQEIQNVPPEPGLDIPKTREGA